MKSLRCAFGSIINSRDIMRECFAGLCAMLMCRLDGFETLRSVNQQRLGIPLNRINDINADVDFVRAGAYAKVKGLLPLFSRPCVSDSHVNSHTRIMHTTWENTQCQKACVYVHSLKQSALHVLLMFTPKHKQTHPRIRARVPGAS